MKSIVMFFRTHIVTVIASLIYFTLWSRALYVDAKFSHPLNKRPNIGVGEGLTFLFFFLIITGGVAALCYCIKAFTTKKNKEFYFVMSFVFSIAVGILIMKF